jgi:nucleotide-binding universal stress UspA family protein
MTGSGRIVVGVDGSPGSRAALRWAADEARLRRARVEAVHCWAYHPVGTELAFLDPAVFEEGAATVLHDAVANLGDTGEVELDLRLVQGPAARTLLDAAEGAQLLVVGARGHGGFTGLLLGSVSQQVVHHAPCPVVIVPTPDE